MIDHVYVAEGVWKLQVCGGGYLEKIILHVVKRTKPGTGDSVNGVVYMCADVNSSQISYHGHAEVVAFADKRCFTLTL